MSRNVKKVPSKNDWFVPDFPDFTSQSILAGSSKKRGRTESIENFTVKTNSSTNIHKKPRPWVPGNELWNEKYEPKTAETLVVQSKKVDEIRNWLLNHIHTGGVLILTGPPGCGKTAAVKALAKELSVQVQEWVSSVEQIGFQGNQAFQFDDVELRLGGGSTFRSEDVLRPESQAKQFKTWLQQSSKSNAICFSDENIPVSNLLLIEDLPNFAFSRPADFQDILKQYNITSKLKRNPLVFICSSEPNNNSQSSAKGPGSMLDVLTKSEELVDLLKMETISLNPATNTNIIKVLSRILDAESKSGSLNGRSVDKKTLELVADASGGDIRAAVNSLQFACNDQTLNLNSCLGDLLNSTSSSSAVASSGPAGRGGRKSAKRSANNRDAPSKVDENKEANSDGASRAAALGCKDQALVLFHALGKVLYAKREPSQKEPYHLPKHLQKYSRTSLISNPEDVMERTAMSSDAFTCFLHQNYLSFFSSIEEVAQSAHFFSESDLLLQWVDGGTRAGKADLSLYGGSVASRAVMFHNKTPAQVKGLRNFTKPELYGVRKTRDKNMFRLESSLASGELFGCGLAKSELFTSVVPLISKIQPKRLPTSAIMAATEIGTMAANRSTEKPAESHRQDDCGKAGPVPSIEELFQMEDDDEFLQMVEEGMDTSESSTNKPKKFVDEDEDLKIEEFDD